MRMVQATRKNVTFEMPSSIRRIVISVNSGASVFSWTRMYTKSVMRVGV